MLKNRLIFTLLFGNGYYHLSRNFSLQKVGDLSWIRKNYEFDAIAHSIDELVVLNVSRQDKQYKLFAENVAKLGENCFMPIAAGGGIVSVEMAYKLFEAGADKVVVNTSLFRQPPLVQELVKIFGGQSIVASIDYKNSSGNNPVYTANGTVETGMTVFEAIEHALQLGVGEIYLTSIDNDGTGRGYDLEALRKYADSCDVPLIASGGAGNFSHFVSCFERTNVKAVSTANLFNFMGDGLIDARKLVLEYGIPLTIWADM